MQTGSCGKDHAGILPCFAKLRVSDTDRHDDEGLTGLFAEAQQGRVEFLKAGIFADNNPLIAA